MVVERRSLSFVGSDEGARWGFRLCLAAAIAVWYVVGRRQWFIRDDWAFLITRPKMKQRFGLSEWLNHPQDGHWMAPPLMVFRLLQNVFGLGSYWPFLIVLLATHLGIVLLVHQICRRLGVSEWVTTLMCAVLLVLGSGWENIVFAVQITYNFSLLAFLAQVLLSDHEGPADHRDWIGAAIAVVGVMSSGFGPFYIFGIALLLGLRRRWKPLLIAVIPQALAYAWWFFTWGSDKAADDSGRDLTALPGFVKRGLSTTFSGVSGSLYLTGAAAIVTAGITIWRRVDWHRRTYLITAWAVIVAMYAGIGLERAAAGPEYALSSRYVYMAAMVIAPVLALGLDQARRFAPWGVWIAIVFLAFAAQNNARLLVRDGGHWADLTDTERRVLTLVTNSGRLAELDPTTSVLPYSKDVTVADIPNLVDQDVVVVRRLTPDEQRQADEILGSLRARS